ncbi:MAG: RHS repeat-associated core domain-containing protein, partial [Saprospiraceae bacterium]
PETRSAAEGPSRPASLEGTDRPDRDGHAQLIIDYNHLDLPTKIRWTSSGRQRLEMTYDAAGTLLRRQKFNSAGTVLETRDYIGGIEYKNGALESVAHAEGRVYFGGGSTERYDYALTDHLGNTRLLYSDLNNNGIPDVPSEIIQEEHYLPFGMKMTGPWMGASNTDHTAYQYNGIEHVADFDLDVNMALYRTLDPLTGRWWQVDPKAEATMGLTPYGSMNNNPINNVDPNGDLVPIALVAAGAILGGAGGGIIAEYNGESFWKGAVIGAFIGANLGAGYVSATNVGSVTSATGTLDKAWGITTSVLNGSVARMTATAITGGGMSMQFISLE